MCRLSEGYEIFSGNPYYEPLAWLMIQNYSLLCSLQIKFFASSCRKNDGNALAMAL